jgi:hypothetical protein
VANFHDIEEEFTYGPNASGYSAATCGTTSEAVDESGMMTSASQSSSSQVNNSTSSQRNIRLAIGPFRQLLAQREFVTLEQLKAMLSQVGMRASDAIVVQMVKELQGMGFLGPQARGRGTKIGQDFGRSSECP